MQTPALFKTPYFSCSVPPTLFFPIMEHSARPHARATYQAYKTLRRFLKGHKIQLNGEDLDIAAVVAVAKYGCTPHLDLNQDVVRGMNESVEVLHNHLAAGYYVYGT
jgi:phenylalanine ammonia-lyase